MLGSLDRWPNIREVHFDLNLTFEIHDSSGALDVPPPTINNVVIDWIAIVVRIAPDPLIRIYRRENTRESEGVDCTLWQSHRLIFNVDHELLNTILNLNRYSISIWQFVAVRKIASEFLVDDIFELDANVSFAVFEWEDCLLKI